MRKFYLPDSLKLNCINKIFIEFINNNPDFLKNDSSVAAVYGIPGYCVWNGGRMPNDKQLMFEELEKKINFYNDRNIAYRYTFTNGYITEKDCYDTYGNFLMDVGNNNKNEFLINSDILELYLRENYPRYKVISSTTKCERNAKNINIQTKKYDMVVIDSRDNRNENFLNSLEDKDKIELLINSWCSNTCNNRQECYSNIALGNLTYGKKMYSKHCSNLKDCFYEAMNDTTNFRNFLSNKEIDNLYSLGFNNFKIESRTGNPVNVLLSYIYYMIKDEYKDIVTNKLFIEFFNSLYYKHNDI